MSKVKMCAHCGATIQEDSNFCHKCGKKIKIVEEVTKIDKNNTKQEKYEDILPNANKKSTFSHKKAILLLSLIFIVFCCFFGYKRLMETHVWVPNFVGKSKTDAKEKCETLSLDCVFTNKYSDEVQKDLIISQNVNPKELVKKHTTILIENSRGKEIVVPDLRGKTAIEAIDILKELGLLYKTSTEFSNIYQEGTLVAPASVSKSEGDTVELVISAGPSVVVPNVVGDTATEAV